MRPLEDYEKLIGYRFQNKQLLETASDPLPFANEHKCKSYERLSLATRCWASSRREYLFEHFPQLPEGQLTKTWPALPRERSLCGFSKALHVGDFLRLSHGERHSGGRERPSILADVFESTTAAIYLDSGSLEELPVHPAVDHPAAKAQSEAPLRTTRPPCRRLSSRTWRRSWSTWSPGRAAPTTTSTSPWRCT